LLKLGVLIAFLSGKPGNTDRYQVNIKISIGFSAALLFSIFTLATVDCCLEMSRFAFYFIQRECYYVLHICHLAVRTLVEERQTRMYNQDWTNCWNCINRLLV